jgi:hypothetical protein
VNPRWLGTSPAPIKPIYLDTAGWYILLESKHAQFLASLPFFIYNIDHYYEKKKKNNIKQETYKFNN